MASFVEDFRALLAGTAGKVLSLLLAAATGVLAARLISEQFPSRESAVLLLLGCGIILTKIAFEVGRGYERA